MGIKCLLRNIKTTEHNVHVSELKGKRVGVDSYCWLHKAITTCAIELVHNRPTRKYIDYMLSRVKLLLEAGCTPIMIFDGRDIPMKEQTNKNRAESRAQSLQKGLRLYQCGDYESAFPLLTQSVLVTAEFAFSVIQEIRQLGVTCIVAPYEADAQLAFLARERYIDVVITEDSDLLVYGTPVVWYKLDRNGYAIEQRYHEARRYLASTAGYEDLEYIQFISLCILSGCDYLSSLTGIGVRKASKLVTKFCNIKDITTALAEDSKNNYTAEMLKKYAVDFEKAMYCFLHHIVYDPEKKESSHFTPLGTKRLKEELIGSVFGASMSKAISEEIRIDPIYLSPYQALKSNKKRITDFFDVQRAGDDRTGGLRSSQLQKGASHPKKSLHEIISSQNEGRPEKRSRTPTTAGSGIKVVSRFFASRSERSATVTSEAFKQRVEVSQASSRTETSNCVVITDDYVLEDSQTLPPTQVGSSDHVTNSQSQTESFGDDSALSMSRSIDCVDGAVRKIARIVSCHRSAQSTSAKSERILAVKSVEEIETFIDGNT